MEERIQKGPGKRQEDARPVVVEDVNGRIKDVRDMGDVDVLNAIHIHIEIVRGVNASPGRPLSFRGKGTYRLMPTTTSCMPCDAFLMGGVPLLPYRTLKNAAWGKPGAHV